MLGSLITLVEFGCGAEANLQLASPSKKLYLNLSVGYIQLGIRRGSRERPFRPIDTALPGHCLASLTGYFQLDW